jgi:hypothetical protein
MGNISLGMALVAGKPKSDATLGLEYAEGLSFNDLLNKQADEWATFP